MKSINYKRYKGYNRNNRNKEKHIKTTRQAKNNHDENPDKAKACYMPQKYITRLEYPTSLSTDDWKVVNCTNEEEKYTARRPSQQTRHAWLRGITTEAYQAYLLSKESKVVQEWKLKGAKYLKPYEKCGQWPRIDTQTHVIAFCRFYTVNDPLHNFEDALIRQLNIWNEMCDHSHHQLLQFIMLINPTICE